jgi:ribonuclease D
MRIVTDQAALEELCAELAEAPYITVDTEFLRERTYWPQLCLIQVARPGDGSGDGSGGGADDDAETAAIIDPIAGDLDLAPFFALMADERVVKVFHAARQDVEIFVHLGDVVPRPMFDTQVAAMVCGHGEQIGYETLVRKIAKASLDKSSRFTDWARRPLSEKQLTYAVGDVTHLRVIYEALAAELERTGRGEWVAEEMAILANPDTYRTAPETAWQRLRTRSASGRVLAAIKTLAAWREREAQARDVPRNRLIKDDALMELAATRPKHLEDLAGSRLLQRDQRRGPVAEALLAAIAEAEAMPREERPVRDHKPEPKAGTAGLVELLKVLLRARCDGAGVAQKLVATSADLDAIAQLDDDAEDDPDIPALHGWRRGVFGADALRLKRGEVALTATRSGVRVVEIPSEE